MPQDPQPAVYDMDQDEDGLWRVTWAATGATVVLDGVPQTRMSADDALDVMDSLEAIDVLTAGRGSQARN